MEWGAVAGNGKSTDRLTRIVRDAADDPISPGLVERLWQADFDRAEDGAEAIDSVVEDTLRAVASQPRAGVLGQDLRRMLERFRHAALLVRADGRIEAMNRAAHRRGAGRRDRDGELVVFLPDSTLFGFCAPLEARFAEAGLEVASVARPGYGATDRTPEGMSDLACMAADVAEVMRQLGRERALLCAHGSSAVFAFALAAAHPGLFHRLLVFAPTLPAPYLSESGTRASFVTAILRARGLSPRLFRLIVRSSAIAWRRRGTQWFARLQLAPCATDSAQVRTRDCDDEFELGLEAQMTQGPGQLERDLLVATEDWSETVRACPVPATLLHGTDDPIIDVALVRRLAADHPHLRLEEVEAAGYLLHLSHPDVFVAALRG